MGLLDQPTTFRWPARVEAGLLAFDVSPRPILRASSSPEPGFDNNTTSRGAVVEHGSFVESWHLVHDSNVRPPVS